MSLSRCEEGRRPTEAAVRSTELKLSKKERAAHLDTLSNFVIAKRLQKHKQFGGVYANDELKRPEQGKIYILNLENANEGGSHWTLLYSGWYFDPFGAPPTTKIQPFVEKYSADQFQKFSGESCGYFTMFVAENIIRGDTPTKGLVPYEFAHNERVLKKYFI